MPITLCSDNVRVCMGSRDNQYSGSPDLGAIRQSPLNDNYALNKLKAEI